MPVLASDFVKRKKEHVFVEGYEIDCVSAATGAIAAAEEVVQIFGQDEVIADINVDNGTLSLTVYDKKDNNKLFDALQELDPLDTNQKQYNWNNIVETSVWINRKNKDNDQYSRSLWLKDWIPVPAVATGDPNAKGTRTFAGNCDVPREFTQPILGEKLKLSTGAGTTWTATLNQTPVQIPNESVYALRVLVINEQRTGTTISEIEKEDLTVVASMVQANKTVTVKLSDLSVLTWATHVYVNYLYNKNVGVHPNVPQIGMYKNVT